jgi:hypothetical protein
VKSVLVLVSLLAGLILWPVTARIRGDLAASFDVAQGRYRVFTFGMPAPGRDEYTRILRARYGIETRVVGGCLVSRSLVAYAEVYNSVSADAANRKFGHDVFQESDAEAGRMWRVRQTPIQTQFPGFP